VNAASGPKDQLDAILARIRRGYPSLQYRFVEGAPVPAARFPVQPGLAFEIGVNVQRDELHLTAGEHFWIEMFPSSRPGLLDDFVASVLGLISGRYRIVESFVAGRAVSARLERQDDRGVWNRTARWSNLGCLLPLPRRERVLQNSEMP
jgi:hypothetical protein